MYKYRLIIAKSKLEKIPNLVSDVIIIFFKLPMWTI